MKIRALSRSDAEWSGAYDGTKHTPRASRNTDPTLHAPARPLDVQRAITAAKVSRTLARPFLFSCSPSHIDGIYCLARSRTDVALMVSAAADGEIRLWHLPSHSPRFHATPQPAAFTRGITFSHDSRRILACNDAKMVHTFHVDGQYSEKPELLDSLTKYTSNSGALASISAHYQEPFFATASSAVEVWDETRSTPVQTLSMAVDSLHCVRYNPVETHVIASAGSDRGITLYDTRLKTPIRSLVLTMRTNDISWNPIEPYIFVAANDDHNCYTFDMRHLDSSKCTYQDHTGAVMTVDYSPTGREFVTGSYDKSIRIFEQGSLHSREVYHTKRMQRVFAARFSLDGGYVVSGSTDGDVRVWKSERSRPLHPMFRGEKEKVHTADKLIERYSGISQVHKIAKTRHVPGHIKYMQKTKNIMESSRRRKESNFLNNSLPRDAEQPPPVPRGKKNVVAQRE